MLWAWGANQGGQLGDGTTASKVKPVQIGTATDWMEVSAGVMHTVALKTNGTLWAWGRNDIGELGDGSTIEKNVPTQIGTSTWKSISAGSWYTMAIKSNGSLWAWGDNSFNQLGYGITAGSSYPIQIGNDTSWKIVDAGYTHTAGIKTNGTLWTWGGNTHGELGAGTTSTYLYAIPAQVGIDTNWRSVKAGEYYTTALRTDNTLWAWGNNDGGQLGDSTIINTNTPHQVGTANNWKYFSADREHTLAIKTDSTLWAWGMNLGGQLGNGTFNSSIWPIKISCNTLAVNDESMLSTSIKLYPNPACEILRLEHSAQLQIDKVEVVDLTGRVVLTTAENVSIIDLHSLSSGMYILQVYSGNDRHPYKFAKQ